MKIDKLNKYKLGNFEIKPKHIYAKEKLTQIYNNILKQLKKNQHGGYDENELYNDNEARNKIQNKINDTYTTNFDFNDENTTEKLTGIINLIKQEHLKKEADPKQIKIINEDFEELIRADEELVSIFDTSKEILESDLIDDRNGLKNQLMNIQKGLFELQVKILFNKLKKIKKVNVTPIFEILNNKISSMNKYMNNLYEGYDEQVYKHDGNDGPVKRTTSAKKDQTISSNTLLSDNDASIDSKQVADSDSDSKDLKLEYGDITNKKNFEKFKDKLHLLIKQNKEQIPQEEEFSSDYFDFANNVDKMYNGISYPQFLDNNKELKNMIDYYNTFLDKDSYHAITNYTDLNSTDLNFIDLKPTSSSSKKVSSDNSTVSSDNSTVPFDFKEQISQLIISITKLQNTNKLLVDNELEILNKPESLYNNQNFDKFINTNNLNTLIKSINSNCQFAEIKNYSHLATNYLTQLSCTMDD
jgi:hypothetical protein